MIDNKNNWKTKMSKLSMKKNIKISRVWLINSWL